MGTKGRLGFVCLGFMDGSFEGFEPRAQGHGGLIGHGN